MYNANSNNTKAAAATTDANEVSNRNRRPKKEKDAKKLKEDILQAFFEIDNYNLENLFIQPAVNKKTNEEFRHLINIRLHQAGQAMPMVKALMPELFEIDGSGSNAVSARNDKLTDGIMPAKFNFLRNGGDGNLHNMVAKQNLKVAIRNKHGIHGTRTDQPPREW